MGNFGWGLSRWEANALKEKFGAMIQRPAAKLSDAEGAQLVEAYLDRARIGDNQREINKLLSDNNEKTASERESKIKTLQTEIDTLRDQYSKCAVTVEAVIEGQISWAIQTLASIGKVMSCRQCSSPSPSRQKADRQPTRPGLQPSMGR